METTRESEALAMGTRESLTLLNDKITMFLIAEDECMNHPLNSRIHNPYQYVFTCSSSKLLAAVRLSMEKFKDLEKKLLNYLHDGGKYSKGGSKEEK
jgi:hypothetical protein